MDKGSKKGSRKSKTKTGTQPAPEGDPVKTPAVQALCMKTQRPKTDRFGTYISLLYLAVVGLLYLATRDGRCGFPPVLEHASRITEIYTGARLSKHTTHAACGRVRNFAHASFFLGGVVPSSGMQHTEGLRSTVRGKWSAPAPSTPYVQYEHCAGDALFALTWGIMLFALRGVLMRVLFVPTARVLVKRPEPDKLNQLSHRAKYEKNINRFGEQFWAALLYFTSFLLVCTSAHRQKLWPWDPIMLWQDYPQTTLDGLTKAMYLWEASNYVHQIFVINLEQRRSDYVQMFFHHIVTLLLIGGSYVCNFTRIGTVILLLLDPSDVLLALAKMLKYMGWQTLCDIMFGAFMISWTVFRHIFYMVVLKSCIMDAPRLIKFAPTIDIQSGYAFTETSFRIFIGLLIVLQLVLLVWYSMILKVAMRVVTNDGAIDSRSDEDIG